MQLAVRRKGPLKPDVNQCGSASLSALPSYIQLSLTGHSHQDFLKLSNLKEETPVSYN